MPPSMRNASRYKGSSARVTAGRCRTVSSPSSTEIRYVVSASALWYVPANASRSAALGVHGSVGSHRWFVYSQESTLNPAGPDTWSKT